MSVAPRRCVNPYSVVAGIVLVGLFAFLTVGLLESWNDVRSFFTPAELHSAAATAWQGWNATILNPFYWAFLVFLCVLQWFFPGRKEQRGLSVGVGTDVVWFLMVNAVAVTIVAAYLGALDIAYGSVLHGWSVQLPIGTLACRSLHL